MVLCLQGQDVSDSIRQAFKHFSQRSASGFIVPEWFPSPDNLQYNAAVHRLDSFIYSLIDQRREELQTRSVYPSTSCVCMYCMYVCDVTDDGHSHLHRIVSRAEVFV